MKEQIQHATNDILYIGFDVHKNSIAIACALSSDADDPQFYGSCGGSNLAAERALNRICKKFNVTRKQIRIAYEAGPPGLVLVRRLLQLGYDTIVVAPSKMERAAGEKVKTDRKDAIKIARQLRSKMLKGIYIPEVKTEAVRDLCRARTDASEDLRRDKQRLCAFLLRQGMLYDGKTNWTEAHMRYLRKMKLAIPSSTRSSKITFKPSMTGSSACNCSRKNLSKCCSNGKKAHLMSKRSKHSAAVAGNCQQRVSTRAETE
ncbi:MAG: transposase [Verrucomicrobiales bacterium]|jgi:transposase